MDHNALNKQKPVLQNDTFIQVLILGAGYGLLRSSWCIRILTVVGNSYTGEMFAVKMMEAGISRDGLRLVDSAGGFGGTW